MKTKLAIILSLTLTINAHAGSATWNLTPATNDWNTASNWTPATVPNSTTDIATFGASNTTNVSTSEDISLGGLIFSGEAPAYTLTIAEIDHRLAIYGDGVRNDSGAEQTILVPSGALFFENASAGDDITYIGQDGAFGGVFAFFDNASAGSATIYAYSGVEQGGFTFSDNSTAADATIVAGPFTDNGFIPGLENGTPSAGQAHITLLGGDGESGTAGAHLDIDGGTIDDATFIAEPATVAGATGATVEILADDLTGGTFTANGGAVRGPGGGGGTILVESPGIASDGTYTINGGTAAGGASGEMTVQGASAGAAFITLNAGTNGGPGGKLTFREGDFGGTSRVAAHGNGFVNLKTNATIGSIEGDGLVKLSSWNLTIGSNNLSTTFSGTIQDAGSITKIGTGTLTLAGANTYSGGTTVTSGVLLVSNASGSGTGTGAVTVNGGTLGGRGIISGAVTVGAGAFLAPAAGTNKKVTLTLQSDVTLQAGATYTYGFKARTIQTRVDLVVANGVTINGATIKLKGQTQGTLTPGTVLTVISNTNANPISGTFSNLTDGAVVTIGGANFQANYEGGDGNDLTLTVVP